MESASSLNKEHYPCQVKWSPEDGEYVGLCDNFPSLSWLAETQELALIGIQKLVANVLSDLKSVPEFKTDAEK